MPKNTDKKILFIMIAAQSIVILTLDCSLTILQTVLSKCQLANEHHNFVFD